MARRRRDDVQGFRGWAVVLVMLSVFYPKYFPNGNIGIDIYFVSSGFLIAMLLKSEETLNFRVISEFYQKRALRIFPLYYLAVILILISAMIALPNSYGDINIRSAQVATMFLSNFREDVTYCPSNIVTEDLLSHFWSICVEVQFYALIPLMFFFQQKFINHEFLGFSSVLFLSLVFHFISRGTLWRFSMFSRLWQFVAGIIAFLATTKWPIIDGSILSRSGKNLEDAPIGHTGELNDKLAAIGESTKVGFGTTLCLISPILLALLPIPLDVMELRLCITSMTALVLYLNCENVALYCNSFITYIGDISFVLYLAHLPVFSIVEHYYDFIYCPFPFGIMITFMLAIISHQYVEGVFRTISPIYGITIYVSLFLIAAAISY